MTLQCGFKDKNGKRCQTKKELLNDLRAHYRKEHMHVPGPPEKKSLQCTYPKPEDHLCSKLCKLNGCICGELCKGLNALHAHYQKEHAVKEEVQHYGIQNKLI